MEIKSIKDIEWEFNKVFITKDELNSVIQEAKKEIFKDKELMLILCNCDRFEDVHLEGCEYLKQRKRLLGKKQLIGGK